MNKLYILGALALSNVDAYINFGTGITTTSYAAVIVAASGNIGTFTYSVTADCFSTGTATTLGMNNIYHQYYSFTVSKGTATYGSVTYTTPAASPAPTTTLSAITAAYNGCSHTHLYNWMAQPSFSAGTAISGFGNNVVAYGYAMSGTAVTACSATTAVTTTIYTSSKFYGAQYQGATAIYSPLAGTGASTTNIIPFYGKVGPGFSYYAKSGSVATWTTITSAGFNLYASQNAYWDFMQTNVVQGATQFGRGGGSSTAPCGWFVVYAYEAPKAGSSTDADLINTVTNDDAVTINMWTDNSVIKAASAFVLTALAGLLF